MSQKNKPSLFTRIIAIALMVTFAFSVSPGRLGTSVTRRLTVAVRPSSATSLTVSHGWSLVAWA